ncbi:hypothetical protein SLA2020_265240 [Shorea laevis]
MRILWQGQTFAPLKFVGVPTRRILLSSSEREREREREFEQDEREKLHQREQTSESIANEEDPATDETVTMLAVIFLSYIADLETDFINDSNPGEI